MKRLLKAMHYNRQPIKNILNEIFLYNPQFTNRNDHTTVQQSTNVKKTVLPVRDSWRRRRLCLHWPPASSVRAVFSPNLRGRERKRPLHSFHDKLFPSLVLSLEPASQASSQDITIGTQNTTYEVLHAWEIKFGKDGKKYVRKNFPWSKISNTQNNKTPTPI